MIGPSLAAGTVVVSPTSQPLPHYCWNDQVQSGVKAQGYEKAARAANDHYV